MTTYALDNAHQAASTRLAMLCVLYDHVSALALDLAHVGRGDEVLDIGTGNGTVAAELARLVGPTGTVHAVDTDLRWFNGRGSPAIVAVEDDIHDVPFDDADTGLDGVHARLALSHIGDRGALLDRIVAALRPAGYVVVSELDPDNGYVPADAVGDEGALGRVCRAFSASLADAGADLHYGYRFPDHARGAGLDVMTTWGHTVRASGAGHPAAALMRANIDQARDRLDVKGRTIDRARRALDAGVGFTMPTLYTTVAHKPGR